MKKGVIKRMDYSMLSSYIGRWTTLLVFSVIILLALGAIFIKEEDIAHTPLSIGVCAFDSVTVWSRFNLLSEFIISNGGPDIRWVYFDPDSAPRGCNFYLMTTKQAAPFLLNHSMNCSLIVTQKDARKYSRGIVIARKGKGRTAKGSRIFVNSGISPSGSISALDALLRSSIAMDAEYIIDYADRYDRGVEKVVFGLLYGGYDFGCISDVRFDYMKSHGLIDVDRLEVLVEGDPVIELVLTSDGKDDNKRTARMIKALLAISSRISPELRDQLESIGVADFIAPRVADITSIKAIAMHHRDANQ